MADVELVIKISEEKLNIIKNKMYCGIYDADLYKSILNGTPLPKGHGVLKDADVMINKLCTHEANEFFGSVTCAEILDFINNEKPIIEADDPMSRADIDIAVSVMKEYMDKYDKTK